MLVKLCTEPRLVATRITLHLTVCMLIARWVLSQTYHTFPVNEFVYYVRYYTIANGISRFQCFVNEMEEKIIIHASFKKVYLCYVHLSIYLILYPLMEYLQQTNITFIRPDTLNHVSAIPSFI